MSAPQPADKHIMYKNQKNRRCFYVPVFILAFLGMLGMGRRMQQ